MFRPDKYRAPGSRLGTGSCRRQMPDNSLQTCASFQIDRTSRKWFESVCEMASHASHVTCHYTTKRHKQWTHLILCQTSNITIRSAHSGLLQGLIADDLMIWRMIRYGAGRVAVRKSFEPTQRQRHVSHSRAPTHAICAALPPRSTEVCPCACRLSISHTSL